MNVGFVLDGRSFDAVMSEAPRPGQYIIGAGDDDTAQAAVVKSVCWLPDSSTPAKMTCIAVCERPGEHTLVKNGVRSFVDSMVTCQPDGGPKGVSDDD